MCGAGVGCGCIGCCRCDPAGFVAKMEHGKGMLIIAVVCLVVGLIVGCTGVGGILVPPALVLWSGYETHMAMGTTLASFMAVAVAGIYMYGCRMRSFAVREAVPFALGGLAGAAPGGLVASCLPGSPLIVMLALVVLFSGVGVFRPAGQGKKAPFWHTFGGLFLIGATTGLMAGLTGAGGPVLSIPWMILVGFNPLTAIGLAQPYQLATAVSGAVGCAVNGNVDWGALPLMGLFQVGGFVLGALIARRMPLQHLRRGIGAICCLLGIFLLFREFWG